MQLLTLTAHVTAPTTDHNTEVTQTTSTTKQISVGGSRGYYQRVTAVQPDRVGLQRITLYHSILASTQTHTGVVTLFDTITASTQDHGTAVTQTTSGIKQIVSRGSHGYYDHEAGLVTAGSPGIFLRLFAIARSGGVTTSGYPSGPTQVFLVT